MNGFQKFKGTGDPAEKLVFKMAAFRCSFKSVGWLIQNTQLYSCNILFWGSLGMSVILSSVLVRLV